MSSLIRLLRANLRHQLVVVISFVFAVGLFFFPLQHYMTLARFQHYGICLAVWAVGFLLQTLVSWRRLGPWGRAYLGVSTLYMALFAGVLYTNPWLDPRVQLETNIQGSLRHEFACVFLVLGIILSGTWKMWDTEEKRRGNK